jgi:hypothetical protein
MHAYVLLTPREQVKRQIKRIGYFKLHHVDVVSRLGCLLLL